MKTYSYEDLTEILTDFSNKFGKQLNTGDQEKLAKLIRSTKKNIKDLESALNDLSSLRNACSNENNNELDTIFNSATTAIQQLHAMQCLGATLELFIEKVNSPASQKQGLSLERFCIIVEDIKRNIYSSDYFKIIGNYINYYSTQLPSNAPFLETAKTLINEIIRQGSQTNTNDNAVTPQLRK